MMEQQVMYTQKKLPREIADGPPRRGEPIVGQGDFVRPRLALVQDQMLVSPS